MADIEELKKLMKEEKFEEVITLATELIAQASENSKYYNSRGSAKYGLELYEDAISDYDKAVELNFNLVNAYRYRGAVNETLGRYTSAVLDYNKSFEI